MTRTRTRGPDERARELSTATEAVACAVEIQGVLAVRNAHFPATRRMEFRIGVHVGEVRVEEERLNGDAVNVAARLQALGPGPSRRARHQDVSSRSSARRCSPSPARPG